MLQTALGYTKIVTLLIASFLLGSPGSNVRHPLHVSTTQAELNSKEKTIEVTSTLFVDDFESLLAKKYKQKVDLGSDALHSKMDELVKAYVGTHLSFKLNGQAVGMNYVGFEIDKEVVNVYFEIAQVNSLNTLETTNTLLYDLFEDQMSIVHVSKGAERKSTKMTNPDRTFTVKF